MWRDEAGLAGMPRLKEVDVRRSDPGSCPIVQPLGDVVSAQRLTPPVCDAGSARHGAIGAQEVDGFPTEPRPIGVSHEALCELLHTGRERLYSASSMRAKSTFMNLPPRVKRMPRLTWTRPCGRLSVARSTQTQTPAPSRRKHLINCSTAIPCAEDTLSAYNFLLSVCTLLNAWRECWPLARGLRMGATRWGSELLRSGAACGGAGRDSRSPRCAACSGCPTP